MSKDIEAVCQACLTCAQYQVQAALEPIFSQPTPTQPWQFFSQDVFELDHKQYLITVDHYSVFYELDPLTNTQSSTIIDLTKARFARYSILLRCLTEAVTDNGPQFVSNEYKTFAKTYGFEHVTSSLYGSRSNGKAQAAVKDAKVTLEKCHDIHLALLNIRNTPPGARVHSFSSAQGLMARRTRSTLPLSAELLKPYPPDPWTASRSLPTRKPLKPSKKSTRDPPSCHCHLVPIYVHVKPRPSQRGTPWIYGQVVDNQSPRSYNVDTGNLVLRCNRNRTQLRPAAPLQNNI